MAAELGREVTLEEVLPCLTAAFEAIFTARMTGAELEPAMCSLPVATM
jgi:hypothetical protein